MGEYFVGDVVLAPVLFDGCGNVKRRPAIVVARESGGRLRVCPVTSRASPDLPSVPLEIGDFATGGLDLFEESYALPSCLTTIRSADVVGKKGRVNEDFLKELSPSLRSAGHGGGGRVDRLQGRSARRRRSR
ncbi:hypothetical protein Metli_1223 [Methanofollis liminatans DSM 4140]|uniref:PemK family protein n=1 Tax=Methanofollis liminatans DSM 4140 TaxID=28892 RepID=J0S990_9EURY|nr:type II toxin-antitoxin system PemK/MazF family toxin [Methanofollis liminatans]EJG07179.1 hypothetical protein Metli_1223 [Methanofollis liminatans DSM 4140]